MPSNKSSYATLIVCSIAALFALQLISRPLAYTGDEPRYIRMAVSLFERGDLGLSFDDWARFAARWNMPSYSPIDFVQPHSPVHALLVAPVVGSLGPRGGRWLSFVVAVFAFLATAALTRRAAGAVAGVGVSLFAFSTLPLLAYSRSLYTEIWLAALVASAWYFLELAKRGGLYKALFLFLALCLPFFHLRMSLVSVGLILIAVGREFEQRPEQGKAQAIKDAAVLAGVAALAAALLLAFQWWLTGSLRGTASAPFEPTLAGFFERTAIQLLTLRHGLFVFNPLMICAVVGLVTSALIGNRLAREGIVLSLLYLVSFVWGAASESAPARFWVAIMPVFAVGLALWIKSPKPWWASLVTALLVMVSLANAALYVRDPNLFLDNREVSLSYDKLFDYIPMFYLPHLLPWDKYFFIEKGFNPHFDQSRALLVWASAVVVSLCVVLFLAIRFRERTWIRRVAGLSLFVLVSYVLWSARLCELPSSSVLPEKVLARGGNSSVIRFGGPIRPVVVRFVGSDSSWNEANYPDMFEVEYLAEGGGFQRVGSVPAGRLVTLPAAGNTQAIRLTASGGAATDARWQEGKIYVLAKACPRWLPPLWPRIPIGKRISFESGGEGFLYLERGWSHQEPWGVWSEGTRARLILPIEKAAVGERKLKVEARALVSPSYPKQDFEVRINGVPATTVRLVRFDANRFEVPVPARVIEALGERGELHIEFRFVNAVRPKDVSINDDARVLALGIEAVTVH